MIFLKSEEHIENIRRAGHIASSVLSSLPFYLKPGMTTKYIDNVIETMIRDLGGTAPCKGYMHGELPPYPAASCISINEEAVHVIPSERVIMDGDVIKVDLVVGFNNWLADTARTFLIPPIKPEVQQLAETCYLALYEGLKKAIDGNRVTDISKAIENFVKPKGYGIVKEFVGHSIGRNIHEDPRVPNYIIKENDSLLCKSMTLCIEPILTATLDASVEINGWYTKSKTGANVVHFEHTCILTEGKPEIVTIRSEEVPFLSNLL